LKPVEDAHSLAHSVQQPLSGSGSIV